MSKVHQLHAERIVLLPLLGAVIAGIICLVGALNRLPGGEPPPAAADHAAPPVSEDHQPLRGSINYARSITDFGPKATGVGGAANQSLKIIVTRSSI